MMRSLYSGVAGLKTHQTRMDVIGNNIANVNTTAYKSQSMTFSDIMYQTTQNASGANENRGGINARQIGLGVKTSAISTAIEGQGASQTTNNPFDIMISGTNFFVVNNGVEQLYTRDGSFYVDGAGNLAMQSTGYFVQGWGSTDGQTVDVNGGIGKLQVMNPENMTYPPLATSNAVMQGNIDQNDSNVRSAAGRVMTLEFYDDRGYLYTAKFSVKMLKDKDGNPLTTASAELGDTSSPLNALKDYQDKTEDTLKNKPMYSITLMDILDSNNVSLGEENLAKMGFGTALTTKKSVSSGKNIADITTDYPNWQNTGNLQDLKSNAKEDDGSTGDLAGSGGAYFGLSDAEIDSYGKDATYELVGDELVIKSGANDEHGKTSVFTFNPDTGALVSPESGGLTLKFDNTPGSDLESFKNVNLDVSTVTNVNTNGSSTFKATKGALDGITGTGRMVGELNGLSVETDGKIWAAYSNGQTKLLGQIATAQFANASGLEKGGDNLYRQTNNSGEASIQDISADGGYMSTGVLEMSNVDLSSEFTTMITTQRGFQANSRIITVSDTLLEELTNLKR